jgi:hypothetical protein
MITEVKKEKYLKLAQLLFLIFSLIVCALFSANLKTRPMVLALCIIGIELIFNYRWPCLLESALRMVIITTSFLLASLITIYFLVDKLWPPIYEGHGVMPTGQIFLSGLISLIIAMPLSRLYIRALRKSATFERLFFIALGLAFLLSIALKNFHN